MLALLPGESPKDNTLQRLWSAWGNENYSGHPEFLDGGIHYAVATEQPVLECGSGHTTILFGIYAGWRDIKVWMLEHDIQWRERMATVMDFYP